MPVNGYEAWLEGPLSCLGHPNIAQWLILISAIPNHQASASHGSREFTVEILSRRQRQYYHKWDLFLF